MPGKSNGKRIVRRSRRERVRLIGAYRHSDLSQRAFATRHGINLGTFVGWLREDRQNGKGESRSRGGSMGTGATFAEVKVKVASGGESTGSIEVLLPDGVRIRIIGATAVEQAAALIRALGNR